METITKREAWNKGKLVGQKPPLKPKDIWAIRIHLQNRHAVRDLAMFNLAIDSKLRGCDLVSVRVRDISHGSQILSRALVIQKKTQRPVQFELTEPTRSALSAWLEKAHLRADRDLGLFYAATRSIPCGRFRASRAMRAVGQFRPFAPPMDPPSEWLLHSHTRRRGRNFGRQLLGLCCRSSSSSCRSAYRR